MAGVKKSFTISERLSRSSLLTKSGCIEWSGYKVDGYGKLRFKGERIFAHRAAYKSAFGEIPNDMCVCHRCDNRSCINPQHLFLGTRADNNQDKTSKQRQASGPNHGLRGSMHPLAVLTANQVIAIRELFKGGMKQKHIAAAYEVSQSAISHIVNKKRWALV